MRTLLVSALLLFSSTTFAKGRCLDDFREMEDLAQVMINQNIPKTLRELSLISSLHQLNQNFKKAYDAVGMKQKINLLHQWRNETLNYKSQTLNTWIEFQRESNYIDHVASNVFFCLDDNRVGVCKTAVEVVSVQQTKINKQYFELMRGILGAYDSLDNFFQKAIETLSKGEEVNESEFLNSLKKIEDMGNLHSSYWDARPSLSTQLTNAVTGAKSCLTEN